MGISGPFILGQGLGKSAIFSAFCAFWGLALTKVDDIRGLKRRLWLRCGQCLSGLNQLIATPKVAGLILAPAGFDEHHLDADVLGVRLTTVTEEDVHAAMSIRIQPREPAALVGNFQTQLSGAFVACAP